MKYSCAIHLIINAEHIEGLVYVCRIYLAYKAQFQNIPVMYH